MQQALRGGCTVEEVHEATGIDPWFLDQIALINDVAAMLADADQLTPDLLRLVKRHGFSDAQVASIRRMPEAVVRGVRHALGVRPVYKTVDTCAAEFAATTPYHYSSYDEETEVEPRERPAVIILGSGPNRIGQGVEFDYSCVHASFSLRDKGFDTVMVNCNPETVSTDYDTSSRLYFEPLTLEDVLEVIHAETQAGPIAGVIVQLGGQTPLGLAQALEDEGVPIVGTSPSAIHLAEDRGAFGQVLAKAGLTAPKHGTAYSSDEALVIAREIGYPVLVRPSYVLGGRGMVIVYDDDSLVTYVEKATEASPDHPILVDRFLDDAIEIDVDALFDGEDMYLGGIMEHVEEAGIHSGDSSCTLPPATLGDGELERVRVATRQLAEGIGVRGLMNVQFALAQDILYVIEANPRASRTVPFVAKATGVPIASAAARVMLGATIKELREEGMLPPTGDGGRMPDHAPVSCKEAVLPFKRFRTKEGVAVDSLLGPEMRSTGEVMGIDVDFGSAFSKAQQGGGSALPRSGAIFVSVANRDKRAMLFPVKRLVDLGFTILATRGTAAVLKRNGIEATLVRKITERDGEAPGEKSIVDLILDGTVQMVVNTPSGQDARADGYAIRAATTSADKPIITTIATLAAAVLGIEAGLTEEIRVKSLQDHARDLDLYGRRDDSSPPPRGSAHERAPAARPRHPGGRGGHRDPPGRRLPAPHPRRAGRRRARPPGPVRRPGRRRRDLRDAAAAVVLDPQGQPQRHLRRHRRDRRLRRRRRHPVDRRARAARHDRRRRTARQGVPAAHRPGRLRPRRRRLRQRPALLARRGAARAWLSRRDGPRRRERGPALRRRRGPAQLRRGHRDDRRRLGRTAGLGQRPAARDHRAAPGPGSSTAADPWGCSSRSPGSRRRTAPWPRLPSRSRWPAASVSA